MLQACEIPGQTIDVRLMTFASPSRSLTCRSQVFDSTLMPSSGSLFAVPLHPIVERGHVTESE